MRNLQVGCDVITEIPPLDPTWFRYSGGVFDPASVEQINPASVVHQEVVFRMSMIEYMRRMQHEAYRIQREKEYERLLAEKTRTIVRLQEQVEKLQTFRLPSLAAVRQAYVEGLINLDEFERLVLHYIAGDK